MSPTAYRIPRIVGITGYAQHGKNTLGEVFVGVGYKQVAFADALKSMALVLDPHILTERDDGTGVWDVRLHWLVEELGWEGAKQNPEVRRFLQVLGTEAVRDHLGENAWVLALTSKLLPGEKYVVTDVRFPNEAAAITGMGGEVWRVERPGFDNGLGTDHPSERHVATLPVAVTFRNVGTQEEFEAAVRHYIGARGTA
jgi:hypothetical protein